MNKIKRKWFLVTAISALVLVVTCTVFFNRSHQLTENPPRPLSYEAALAITVAIDKEVCGTYEPANTFTDSRIFACIFRDPRAFSPHTVKILFDPSTEGYQKSIAINIVQYLPLDQYLNLLEEILNKIESAPKIKYNEGILGFAFDPWYNWNKELNDSYRNPRLQTVYKRAYALFKQRGDEELCRRILAVSSGANYWLHFKRRLKELLNKVFFENIDYEEDYASQVLKLG